jgi:hypothetical protein
LGGLPITRHTLESLPPDGVRPGSEILVPSANSAILVHARTVRLVRQEPGHYARGPYITWPRTIRASLESIVACSYRSNWRPDRCQHSSWSITFVLDWIHNCESDLRHRQLDRYSILNLYGRRDIFQRSICTHLGARLAPESSCYR